MLEAALRHAVFSEDPTILRGALASFRLRAGREGAFPASIQMKRDFWDLREDVRDAIMADLERRTGAVMGRLGVAGTRRLVEEHVKR